MVSATSPDRLQPSLLDRLTDADPDKEIEPLDRRALSPSRLREIIRRDLATLLNTTNTSCVVDLSSWHDVAASTLNYGIPDLAGISLASADVPSLEQALRQAILCYEPRIRPRSLSVKARVGRAQMNRAALTFHIDGEIWTPSGPEGIALETVVDLETGEAAVAERSR